MLHVECADGEKTIDGWRKKIEEGSKVAAVFRAIVRISTARPDLPYSARLILAKQELHVPLIPEQECALACFEQGIRFEEEGEAARWIWALLEAKTQLRQEFSRLEMLLKGRTAGPEHPFYALLQAKHELGLPKSRFEKLVERLQSEGLRNMREAIQVALGSLSTSAAVA